MRNSVAQRNGDSSEKESVFRKSSTRNSLGRYRATAASWEGADAGIKRALQFDRVDTRSTSALPDQFQAICANCQTSIESEYYDVNGSILCSRCRTALESAAETPRGIVPFLTAAIFGLGAGVAGAAIYFVVIAVANLEIGIVAILIGYMVGRAVRKGARGRSGRRYQVLAVVLTYASVALAYTPIAPSCGRSMATASRRGRQRQRGRAATFHPRASGQRWG